jgi:hypothetical protein
MSVYFSREPLVGSVLVEHATIDNIVGFTPIKITVSSVKQEIIFDFSNGYTAIFYHEEDCCEYVAIDDICGDFDDLVGHPILVAEERIHNGEKHDSEEPPKDEWDVGTSTWTFYCFRSVGGSVDVRWHGTSNGYYSEAVDFVLYKPDSE